MTTCTKKKNDFGFNVKMKKKVFRDMAQCPHVSRAGFINEGILTARNDLARFRAFRAFWYILSQNLATGYFCTYPSAPKLLFEQELYESFTEIFLQKVRRDAGLSLALQSRRITL